MGEVEDAILAEARTEVSYADQKASMVLAALGIGFGTVLGGLFASDWSPSELRSYGEVAWWVGCAFAAASVGSAALAVWPRTHISAGVNEIYYWGHVARFKSVEALKQALNEYHPSVEARTHHQMWELCRIVKRKYELVRLAFICATSAVITFGVAGLSLA